MEPEPQPRRTRTRVARGRAADRAAAKAGGPQQAGGGAGQAATVSGGGKAAAGSDGGAQRSSASSDDGGQAVVRIKPMGAGGGGGETSAAAAAAPMQFSTRPPAVRTGAHEFSYPRHVIGPERDQQSLFDEFMPARIDGFLSGNNVNVMAYGQTGSGKTHTVFGPPGVMARAGAGELGHGVCDDYGIFPRGLWTIYERVQALNAAGAGTSYVLTASCVELSLVGNLDMLVKSHDERNAQRDKGWTGWSDGTGPQLDKFSKPPKMYGMVELPMDTPDDLLRIFTAIASRNTAGTLMNDSSSRSHCICWLTLFAHDKATDAVRRSRFQFVDLAGSERVKEASGGSDNLWAGGTATEGLMTNWSLMMLSTAARDVIASTRRAGKKGGKQKLAHTGGYLGDLVPLLADSLTGDALTALFVCVSQAPDNVSQSKIALDFGQVFSQLTMGKKQQKPESRAKLVKELLAKQEANDATLAKGVNGKFQAIRMGQRLDYVQVLAALERFAPIEQ